MAPAKHTRRFMPSDLSAGIPSTIRVQNEREDVGALSPALYFDQKIPTEVQVVKMRVPSRRRRNHHHVVVEEKHDGYSSDSSFFDRPSTIPSVIRYRSNQEELDQLADAKLQLEKYREGMGKQQGQFQKGAEPKLKLREEIDEHTRKQALMQQQSKEEEECHDDACLAALGSFLVTSARQATHTRSPQESMGNHAPIRFGQNVVGNENQGNNIPFGGALTRSNSFPDLGLQHGSARELVDSFRSDERVWAQYSQRRQRGSDIGVDFSVAGRTPLPKPVLPPPTDYRAISQVPRNKPPLPQLPAVTQQSSMSMIFPTASIKDSASCCTTAKRRDNKHNSKSIRTTSTAMTTASTTLMSSSFSTVDHQQQEPFWHHQDLPPSPPRTRATIIKRAPMPPPLMEVSQELDASSSPFVEPATIPAMDSHELREQQAIYDAMFGGAATNNKPQKRRWHLFKRK